MNTTKLLIAALPLITFLGSCKKSGSDESVSTLQFQIGISNPLVTVNKITGPGTIRWNSGSAYATQVKLEAKQNGNELEFKSSNPRQVDLFAPVATTLGNVSIPAGSYSELEFKISLSPGGSGTAMELNGEYTNGSGGISAVKFILNSLIDLKAEQSSVIVNSNTTIGALTTLDLSFVTDGITQAMLDNAVLTNGSIIISSTSNSNLYTIILNNLHRFHHMDVTHH
ncbi:MAG: hypothetical protein WAU23_06125 [Ferruginibacter sp.]